jgi:hypothetical protein
MSSVITPPPIDKIGESHLWRDWFVKLAKFVMPSRMDILPSSITVTASPFKYQNGNNYPTDIIIQGGTVSLIEISRDNASFFSLGTLTNGIVNLSSGDYIRVTYSAAPTMTQVPR